jgi:hypothetical protein
MVSTSLPHKRLADDAVWENAAHRVTLMIEPGRMKVKGKTVFCTVCRMTEAVPNQDPKALGEESGHGYPLNFRHLARSIAQRHRAHVLPPQALATHCHPLRPSRQ